MFSQRGIFSSYSAFCCTIWRKLLLDFCAVDEDSNLQDVVCVCDLQADHSKSKTSSFQPEKGMRNHNVKYEKSMNTMKQERGNKVNYFIPSLLLHTKHTRLCILCLFFPSQSITCFVVLGAIFAS